jgi:glycerophosphoryl diester phosphodiesterase
MKRWLPWVFLLISGLYLAATQMADRTEAPLKKTFANNSFDVLRVAHAGGGIDGKTYTNSYEALEHNYKKGFRYFELDFSTTTDGQLVCIHDWQGSFENSFGLQAGSIPTLTEFIDMVAASSRFENCTLKGVADWMRERSEAVLITDIKDDNLAGLRTIRDEIPEASFRVIPQIYDPNNFATVRKMGFSAIIWTLYRYRGSEEDVLEWVDILEPPMAVTMPERRAESGLPKHLFSRQIPTYVHTINSEEKVSMYLKRYWVTEIYTDFLPPQ